MREGISHKIVFSKIIMEKVIEQLEDLVKSKSQLVEKSTSISKRTNMIMY